MSSEFTTVRLGDLVVHRKGFPFKSSSYQPAGIPVIRVSNFTDNSINPNDLKFVSQDVAHENSNVALKSNDIVIATVGSWPSNPASVVGRTILVPSWASNALMNQNSVIIRARSNSSVDQKFIYFCMKSENFSTHVVSKAQGSANQASITLDAIFSFPVAWPDAATREKIVTILNALDDRITLLRETNKTLEAIAQAIFKSWFVDFDPVRAKMEGRQPEGMDKATATLFPDSFEESELGLVPKGWKVGTLEDIAALQNGYAFKSKDWTDQGYPVVKIGDVKPGIINLNNCSFVAPETTKGLERFQLYRGDLLVGMTGYVGETGLVPSVDSLPYLNQRVGRIIPKPNLNATGYIYCAVRNSAFKVFASTQSHGSAQANVSGSSLMAYPIVLGTHQVISTFNTVITALIESILSHHERAEILANLCDTILPRLISGQLRLPEAQEQIENALT